MPLQAPPDREPNKETLQANDDLIFDDDPTTLAERLRA